MHRKLTTLLFLILAVTGRLFAQSNAYYYYHDQIIPLAAAPDQIAVRFNQPVSAKRVHSIIDSIFGGRLQRSADLYGNNSFLIKFDGQGDPDLFEDYVTSFNSLKEVKTAVPVYRSPYVSGVQVALDEFLVRFHADVSSQDIRSFNKQYDISIKRRLRENTYLFVLNASAPITALEAANLYYESDLTEWAAPNFIYPKGSLFDATVNDPYWPSQWAHKNTGQSVASGASSEYAATVNGLNDADMDIDEAWDLLIQNGGQAGGSADILVAMLDSGIDLDHPDLSSNLFSDGIDFSPDNNPNADDSHGHGTCTAGIVAAAGNNGEGVAGIAYHSLLLPLKFFSKTGSASDEAIAAAIDTAWQMGADIISNSWSGSSPNQAIDDAIHRAKTLGRDGKGCVVVFSSGNEGHASISYPSDLSDVIAVGASNMFDEKKNSGSRDLNRKWAANYGAGLDLVAPTTVYTTNLPGGIYSDSYYIDYFGGTSAACPQVSGVSALILAADPGLTSDEVQQILQTTTDRIERYTYDGNGWNKHVGYGRVNAANALRSVLGMDGQAPLIAHTPLSNNSSAGDQTVSADISDNSGIQEAGLFYRTIFEGDTSLWQNISDADGPTGDTYEFIIPAISWGTQVQYYLYAQDASVEQNEVTFPFGGDKTMAPETPLIFFVGEFSNQTYTSSDVPVSIPDDGILYISNLNIPDSRIITHARSTISISGNIQDYEVTLEDPLQIASGITQMNGEPGNEYLNTRFDDDAATPISDGVSPYSGSYQPDNALVVFNGRQAQGNWSLRVYDVNYYNNGGSIDNWDVEVTYMLPVNPPVVSDIPDQTIDEGGSFEPIYLDNYVTDADNTDEEITWTASGNTDLIVDIDSTTRIATISTPDADWYGQETIYFTATDPTLLSDADSAVFTVTAVNDTPSVSDIPDQTVQEGESFAQFDLDDYVTDPDDPDSTINWTADGQSELNVTIDPQTHIATVTAPNDDWNGSETIRFTATDPGGLSDSDTARFTVTAVNDTPAVSDIPDQTVQEGESFAQFDLDDYVTDPDDPDSTINWTADGQTELNVSIDPQTHIAIVTAPNEDWNGSETIRFTATDPGGLSDSDTARFTVTAVNDTPAVSDIPDQTVQEGESFAQFDLDDYVTDPDDPDSTINWTADGQIELNVSIDPQTHITTVTAPNDQWNGSETIRFTATDPGGLSDSDTARFTVTAVNDTPSVSDIPDQTVLEGESFAQFDLDDYVTDPDDPDSTINWTADGQIELNVTIDPQTHIATVTAPNDQWNGSETIRFTATDPGGLSDSDTARFTVTAVNDTPAVSDIPDQTVLEGESFAQFDLDDYVTDPDDPDSTINWAADGQIELSVTIDPQTHIATVTAPNDRWNGSETIRFTATDPGGLSDSDTARFTVTAVNDTPAVSDIPDQTVLEGESFAQFDLDDYVTDVDDPDSTINWTADGQIELNVSIDPQTHIATVTAPNDQWNGSETIRFTATDPGGLSDSDTARFTVTAVNDTPSVSDIPGQTALEGESFAQFDLDDYVIDPDDPDSTINWTADGQIELNVSIDPQTHIATVTAPNDQWNGSETIRFTATDPGGLSDSDTARFTVTAVNDTPSVSDIPDQTVQEGESFAQFDLDDYVSDADNSDAEITWTYKGNRQLQVNIDTLSHVATVTPPNSQWNGSETIRFIATDPDQKSDSDTARFTVTAVNQPPVVSDIPDQTIAEGDSFAVIILDQYVQDPDNADEDMVWTYRGNNQLSVTISADRKARILLPSSEWNGSERIWFKAADPGGLADEDSALFTVEAVNDPPRFTSPLPRLSFAEDDSLYQSVTAWYPNVEDADNPDSTLHFQVLDSSFVWAKDLSGQFLFKALSDWFGTDTLRLKVTDGALADTTILKITVSAVNDAPNIVGLPDSLVFLNTDTVILNLAEYEEDVDTPSEKLFWEMSASDTLLLTEFNPDSKQLTLRAPALNGYAHLYLTLRDDSSAQAQDSILLHVKKDPTSISETGGGVPLFFALEQNYPNPFNPSTLINYSIGSTQGSFVSVRLDIYNIMGQKVTTLIDERQAPGRYKALWKADGLASGVYFYRLVAGKFVSVKKMILMR